MSNQQDQQPMNTPHTTPTIPEYDQEYKDINYEHDGVSSTGCFRLFCCFDNHRPYHQPPGDLINQDTWFMKRAKSVKEYSELVAGPKWKNFIRRFSRKTKTRSNATTPFQYDPQSYALNFSNQEDDDLLPRSFSTRYAPPSRSTQV